MLGHHYHNDSDEGWVRLSYSNAPLLEKLEVHYVEEFDGDTPPSDANARLPEPREGAIRARDLALREQITPEGAWLLGYDWLIDVDVLSSEEHTSELQSIMRISYAVFCLKKKQIPNTYTKHPRNINI